MSEALKLTAPKVKNHNRATQQDHGEGAEDILEGYLDTCKAKHLGVLRRRYPRVIISKGKPIYVASAGVDFTGHLADGRACYIECKFTQEQSMPLRLIRDSQWEEMARAMSDQVVSVLILLRGVTPEVATIHAIPWWVVSNAKQMDSKSLRSELIDLWKVKLNQPLLLAEAFKVKQV